MVPLRLRLDGFLKIDNEVRYEKYEKYETLLIHNANNGNFLFSILTKMDKNDFWFDNMNMIHKLIGTVFKAE